MVFRRFAIFCVAWISQLLLISLMVNEQAAAATCDSSSSSSSSSYGGLQNDGYRCQSPPNAYSGYNGAAGYGGASAPINYDSSAYGPLIPPADYGCCFVRYPDTMVVGTSVCPLLTVNDTKFEACLAYCLSKQQQCASLVFIPKKRMCILYSQLARNSPYIEVIAKYGMDYYEATNRQGCQLSSPFEPPETTTVEPNTTTASSTTTQSTTAPVIVVPTTTPAPTNQPYCPALTKPKFVTVGNFSHKPDSFNKAGTKLTIAQRDPRACQEYCNIEAVDKPVSTQFMPCEYAISNYPSTGKCTLVQGHLTKVYTNPKPSPNPSQQATLFKKICLTFSEAKQCGNAPIPGKTGINLRQQPGDKAVPLSTLKSSVGATTGDVLDWLDECISACLGDQDIVCRSISYQAYPYKCILHKSRIARLPASQQRAPQLIFVPDTADAYYVDLNNCQSVPESATATRAPAATAAAATQKTQPAARKPAAGQSTGKQAAAGQSASKPVGAGRRLAIQKVPQQAPQLERPLELKNAALAPRSQSAGVFKQRQKWIETEYSTILRKRHRKQQSNKEIV